jgi:hypothetical protein
MDYLLGLENQIGLEFLYCKGLVKKGAKVHCVPAAVLVDWDKFITDENLKDIMEMVNKPTADHKK